MSVFYWTIAGYILVGGGGVGVFLWGKEHGNSIFDRLYRIFCMHLPRLLKKGLEKCFGKRAPACLDAAWVYVCYTSNPLVQLFYLLVVVGGYATFVAYSHPHLPNRFIGNVHKYIGFIIFSLCLAVWWRACTTDPGTITDQNVDKICDVWKWDEQIFHMAQCRSCDLIKPARSKHCSLCQRCVARFDHHCIWINNCVGVGNHRYFLGFLGMHLVICFYGFGLTATILYEIIVSKDLLSAVFVKPDTRERFTATKLMVGQYLLATEGMVVFICVLCCIMGIVLFGFFGWHLYLVRSGTTTNELSKWSYLRMCLKHEGEEGKEKIKLLNNEYNQGPVRLPADLQRTGRFQGQKGNVDSGSKPKTTLAQVMNKGIMDQRETTSMLSRKLPHKAGTGYGMYDGPCRPASWSACETALVQGRKDWKVTESEQVTTAEAKLHTDKLDLGKKYNCKLSSRFQPLDPATSNYYFQLPTTPHHIKYSNNQVDAESPKSQRAREMAAAAQ
eukprot:s934_g1.t1